VIIGDFRVGERDILLNGPGEEDTLLEGDSYQGTEVILGELPDIGAIDGDPPGRDVVKSRDQVDEGGLP